MRPPPRFSLRRCLLPFRASVEKTTRIRLIFAETTSRWATKGGSGGLKRKMPFASAQARTAWEGVSSPMPQGRVARRGQSRAGHHEIRVPVDRSCALLRHSAWPPRCQRRIPCCGARVDPKGASSRLRCHEHDFSSQVEPRRLSAWCTMSSKPYAVVDTLSIELSIMPTAGHRQGTTETCGSAYRLSSREVSDQLTPCRAVTFFLNTIITMDHAESPDAVDACFRVDGEGH